MLTFDQINRFLLPALEGFLSEWIPGGKVDGGEYVGSPVAKLMEANTLD